MIAHLADIHLGAKPYQMEFRRKDIFEAFSELVDTIIREKPDLVVVAGDFFDNPRPDNDTLIIALRELRKLVDKGFPIVFTYGEHDYPKVRDRTPVELLAESFNGKVYAPPKIAFHGGRPVIDPFIYKMDGLTIYLTPFIKASLEKRREITKEIMTIFENDRRNRGGKALVVAHLSFETDFPFGSVLSSPALLPRVDYAAMGHIHRPSICLEDCLDHGVTPYAYPGSLEALRKDEIIEEGRGYYLVDLSGDEPVIHRVTIRSIRPQYVIESTPDRLMNDIGILKLKHGDSWIKEPLIHVELSVPRERRITGRTLNQLIETVKSKYRVHIRVWYKTIEEETRTRAESSVLDIRDMIARLLDPSRKKDKNKLLEVAGIILELKEVLLSGANEDLENLFNRLSGYEKLLLDQEKAPKTLDSYW
ncbi:MAG: exonuclease SbcCD subunit D [Desulfurococcales archaeon]|nr:exonuclease SbcCD subunit D [Desulfurococcales archaeon]